MRKRPLTSASLDVDLALPSLERLAEGWLLDGEIRQHSRATRDLRKIILDKLVWFLKQNESPACGTHEIRQFLAYLSREHSDDGGRWGNARQVRPVRPITVHTYHGHLRTFFRWVVEENALEQSPIESIAAPIARADQIQPFSESQVDSLLASKRTTHPRRDEAILLLLLDTGLRASEVCGLRSADIDIQNRHCTVLGKGNKHRMVCLGQGTTRALWNYLREEQRDPGEPLFLSNRGTSSGEPLTRSGLLQLIERLGKAAGVHSTRCSPHTFRHTFAVSFLRNGGNVFSLQQILGHTTLAMTNRYVAFAQADIENQHRLYSPVDCFRRARKRS